MKPFFKNLINAALIALYGGGIIIGIVLTIGVKSVAGVLSILALGALAFPTVKKIALGMNKVQ